MGAGASSKKYTGRAVESDSDAPKPQLRRSLTIEECAAGHLSQPKVCNRCCVGLVELKGIGGAIINQCPQCGMVPGRRSMSKNNLQIKPPEPTNASEFDGPEQDRSASKASAARSLERRPSKDTSGSHARRHSFSHGRHDERRPSKERSASRSSSKVSTEAPSRQVSTESDSPHASPLAGELPPLDRVVRRRSTHRRSFSLPGVDEDVPFAPGDKVIFIEYDALAEESFGIGVVAALGEKPGIVRVKFEKQEQTFDFKTETLKKCSQVEERSIKHGSKLARRNTISGSL